MAIRRRTLVVGGAALAGAAALGGPFRGLVAGPVGTRETPHGGGSGADAGLEAEALGAPAFRNLHARPDLRDGAVRLHLPEGFSYRSFHDTESPIVLDDGTDLPGRHDGMAAFDGPDGLVTLVRNHEVNHPGPAFGPLGDWTYDPMAQGGCTVVNVSHDGQVDSAWTGINGTMMNCSGGPMPWGSWITCEETINGPDVGPDFTGTSNVPLTQPHGYLFEVPTSGRASGEPITAAGRFAHEAVALDPVDGYLYLTEDNFGFASGFFRYLPSRHPMESGHIDNDGTLQMLAVRGRPNAHLEATQPHRASYRVEWVDIDEPNPSFPYTPGETAPTTNDAALVHVGNQGRARGAAVFSRLEGAIYDDGVVYFTSTQGGGPAEESVGPIGNGYGNGFGQVWAYHCRSSRLELIYQSPGKPVFDLPDNITVSNRGTLVVCEDSSEDNYLRGLNRGGQLWDIALNRVQSARDGRTRFDDEFAGSTFSPNGETLYVNIQASAGMTFAIWGPWHEHGV